MRHFPRWVDWALSALATAVILTATGMLQERETKITFEEANKHKHYDCLLYQNKSVVQLPCSIIDQKTAQVVQRWTK